MHLVGKDILRFHAVYWPAFLLAAGFGEAKLPSKVYAHGFLTVDGMKMSKTLRNTVSPLRLAKELGAYGGADVLRYELMKGIAFGQDGDFDHAAMITRYNADLAKNVGNLLSRTLGLCVKLTGGKAPVATARTPLEDALDERCAQAFAAAARAWEDIAPHRALEATLEASSAANQYVDRAAPWTAAKNGDQARVDTILATLLGVLEAISVMMWPVLPTKAQELRAQLGLAPFAVGADAWPTAVARQTAPRPLSAAVPLFPTIDEDAARDLLDRLVPKIAVGAPDATPKGPRSRPPPPRRCRARRPRRACSSRTTTSRRSTCASAS